MQTSMGHDLTRRDPESQSAHCYTERTPEQYRLHIAELMSRAGAWQALMRQNELRAKKRRDVA